MMKSIFKIIKIIEKSSATQFDTSNHFDINSGKRKLESFESAFSAQAKKARSKLFNN